MAEQRSMEDVLASIRRIVREEERSAGSTGSDAVEESGAAEEIPLPKAFRPPSDGEQETVSEPARAAKRPDEEIVLTSSMRKTGEDALDDDEEDALPLSPLREVERPSETEAAAPLRKPAAAPEPEDDDGDEPLPLRQGFAPGAPAAEAAASQEDPAAAPEPEPVPPAAPAIDEAMLEEMIRKVVRQELSGSFGVTLSKNIQKLVQDEIRKALARGL